MKTNSLIKNSNYLKYLTAQFITKFGDAIDSIALSWMIYVLTGSKILMGTIFAVSFIPNLIFTPLGGISADKNSKKKQAVMGDLGRGVSVAIMAVMYAMGMIEVWHIFVFTIINSTFESYSGPARGAMVSLLLDKNEYMKASSLSSSVGTFAELLGLGLAGVIIAKFGVEGAILVDALTFFGSGIVMMTIKYKEELSEKSNEKTKIKDVFLEMKDSLVYVKSKKVIMVAILAGAFLNLSFVPFNVLRPVYVSEIMKMGAEGLSITGIALTVGIIIGGLLLSQFGDKLKEKDSLFIGFVAMGVSYSLLGLPVLWGFKSEFVVYGVALFTFSFGFFFPFVQASIQSLIFKEVDKDKIGKVISILSLIGLGAVPLGGVVVGFVGEIVSVDKLYLVMGIVAIVVGIIARIHISNLEKTEVELTESIV